MVKSAQDRTVRPVRGRASTLPASGRFSSDRTITEYANETWNAKPWPVSLIALPRCDDETNEHAA